MSHKVILVGSLGLHAHLLATLACVPRPPILIVVDPMSAPAKTDAEVIHELGSREEERKKIKQMVLHNFVQCSAAQDRFDLRQDDAHPKMPFYHGVPRRKRGRK